MHTCMLARMHTKNADIKAVHSCMHTYVFSSMRTSAYIRTYRYLRRPRLTYTYTYYGSLTLEQTHLYTHIYTLDRMHLYKHKHIICKHKRIYTLTHRPLRV